MKTISSGLALVVTLMFGIMSASCGNGKSLVSITVTPNPVTINAPSSVQLTATGKFSDGAIQVLSSANWTSSSPAVNVSNTGLASCSLLAGPVVQVTITASASATASSMGVVQGSTTLFCAPPNP